MKHKFLKSMALVLAFSGFAPMAQAETQAEVDARAAQENISKNYIGDVQKSVSAYFNTLNIKSSQVKEGLTIPWVNTAVHDGWFGYKATPAVNGFAVASGKTGANGCPIFKVIAFDHDIRDTQRVEANFTICP